MTSARRFLGPLATLCLTCQLVMVVVSPVVFLATSSDASVQVCTCTHGTDAACPMHHKRSPGSTVCVMQSATQHPTILATPLLGIVGLIPESTALPVPTASGILAIINAQIDSQRPVSPDPPPPRA